MINLPESLFELPVQVTDLLLEQEMLNQPQGWESRQAKLNAFYIRGVSSFRNFVYSGPLNWVQDKRLDFSYAALFESREHWAIPGFHWSADFVPRYFQNALSQTARRPVPFHHAVKIILACHKILNDKIA